MGQHPPGLSETALKAIEWYRKDADKDTRRRFLEALRHEPDVLSDLIGEMFSLCDLTAKVKQLETHIEKNEARHQAEKAQAIDEERKKNKYVLEQELNRLNEERRKEAENFEHQLKRQEAQNREKTNLAVQEAHAKGKTDAQKDIERLQKEIADLSAAHAEKMEEIQRSQEERLKAKYEKEKAQAIDDAIAKTKRQAQETHDSLAKQLQQSNEGAQKLKEDAEDRLLRKQQEMEELTKQQQEQKEIYEAKIRQSQEDLDKANKTLEQKYQKEIETLKIKQQEEKRQDIQKALNEQNEKHQKELKEKDAEIQKIRDNDRSQENLMPYLIPSRFKTITDGSSGEAMVRSYLDELKSELAATRSAWLLQNGLDISVEVESILPPAPGRAGNMDAAFLRLRIGTKDNSVYTLEFRVESKEGVNSKSSFAEQVLADVKKLRSSVRDRGVDDVAAALIVWRQKASDKDVQELTSNDIHVYQNVCEKDNYARMVAATCASLRTIALERACAKFDEAQKFSMQNQLTQYQESLRGALKLEMNRTMPAVKYLADSYKKYRDIWGLIKSRHSKLVEPKVWPKFWKDLVREIPDERLLDTIKGFKNTQRTRKLWRDIQDLVKTTKRTLSTKTQKRPSICFPKKRKRDDLGAKDPEAEKSTGK